MLRRKFLTGLSGLFLGGSMPEVLQPDAMAATIADLNRRLQILEATSRVGLSGVRTAWQTATAATTVLDAYESGPAGAAWQDDQGNTGTGYPVLTITNMPARAWLLWECRPANIGFTPAATYRSVQAQPVLAINGAAITSAPSNRRGYSNFGDGQSRAPVMGSAIRTFTAGASYTFQMQVKWDDTVPANPTMPTLTDAQIIVLPLSAA